MATFIISYDIQTPADDATEAEKESAVEKRRRMDQYLAAGLPLGKSMYAIRSQETASEIRDYLSQTVFNPEAEADRLLVVKTTHPFITLMKDDPTQNQFDEWARLAGIQE